MLPDVVSFLDFPVFGLAPHIPARRSVLSLGHGWSWNEGYRVEPVLLSHQDCHGRADSVLLVESRRMPIENGSERDALLDDRVVNRLWLETRLAHLPQDPDLRSDFVDEVIHSVPHPGDLPSKMLPILVDGNSVAFKVFRIGTTWTAWAVAEHWPVYLFGYEIAPEDVAVATIRDLGVYLDSSRPFTGS